uniref:Uncharacterized protein n=1 Tax=Arundo donax TaxID=35708 RepID=A0A0A9E1B1_ARUDO
MCKAPISIIASCFPLFLIEAIISLGLLLQLSPPPQNNKHIYEEK